MSHIASECMSVDCYYCHCWRWNVPYNMDGEWCPWHIPTRAELGEAKA